MNKLERLKLLKIALSTTAFVISISLAVRGEYSPATWLIGVAIYTRMLDSDKGQRVSEGTPKE